VLTRTSYFLKSFNRLSAAAVSSESFARESSSHFSILSVVPQVVDMSNFKVLNDEHKILRRKEKEVERQAKIQEKLSQAQTPNVGSWADASDEDEEDEKLFRPVSDSESSASEDDSKPNTPSASPKQKPRGKGYPEGGEPVPELKAEAAAVNGKKADIKKPAETPEIKAKSKKDRKAEKAPVKEEEDLDAILADLGLPITEVPDTAAASRRKKKKAGAAEAAEEGKEEQKPEAKAEAKSKAKAKAKAEAKKEEVAEIAEGAGDEEATPEEKEAAVEAMRKKMAAKKTSKTSDAAKCAAAEAKKRTANQKTKKDKSGYDR